MWKEYTDNSIGVAIRTTLGRLKKSLTWLQGFGPVRPRILKISYIDHAEWFEPKDGPYQLLSYKDKGKGEREGFEWEQEVRLVAVHPKMPECSMHEEFLLPACVDKAELQTEIPSSGMNYGAYADTLCEFYEAAEDGINYCKVHLPTLIEAVYLYPGADEQFADKITRMVRDNGLNPSIVTSSELPTAGERVDGE